MPGKPKGLPKTGGRQKGTPNKTTQEARKLFESIMDRNVGRIEQALEEIYDDDKQKFLYVINKYFPYYLPKQEQIDITIDSTELPFSISIESREKTDPE